MDRTIDSADDESPRARTAAVLVAAYDEAERLGATLGALAEAFPGSALWVADDGSRDATGEIARTAGARVVRLERMVGKGEAMTLAAREALAAHPPGEGGVFVLCDGDLGASAGRLGPLAQAVASGQGELAVAVFSRRTGGGLGVTVGFARWAIRRGCGVCARAPISGQRALSREALAGVLPLAHGYGMEVGMTIDAVRAGRRLVELELDLSHRATGRSLGGFLHRSGQLLDIARAYAARR